MELNTIIELSGIVLFGIFILFIAGGVIVSKMRKKLRYNNGRRDNRITPEPVVRVAEIPRLPVHRTESIQDKHGQEIQSGKHKNTISGGQPAVTSPKHLNGERMTVVNKSISKINSIM